MQRVEIRGNTRLRDAVKTIALGPKVYQKISVFLRLENLWIMLKFFYNFSKNAIITSNEEFFRFFGIFPTCIGCFLPADTADKNMFNYRSFPKPYCCSIQSLKAIECD